MTEEQRDETAAAYEDWRAFAATMETLSAALDGGAWNDETGAPMSVQAAAERAVYMWERVG